MHMVSRARALSLATDYLLAHAPNFMMQLPDHLGLLGLVFRRQSMLLYYYDY